MQKVFEANASFHWNLETLVKGSSVKHWFDRNGLWAISILISLSFAALDGRYLRSYMFAGPLGDVCAYTGNFLIDMSSEYLMYEFTRHQRDTVEGRARDRKRLLSWSLLIGSFGLLYFALIFSWRQASLIHPEEPLLLRWSIAAFAQAALLLLGVASALRDVPAKKERHVREVATSDVEIAPVPSGNGSESHEEPQEQWVCEVCGKPWATYHALNAHMKVHKREMEVA